MESVKAKLKKGKGIGIKFKYYDFGWEIVDILENPGQPELRLKDVITGVGGSPLINLGIDNAEALKKKQATIFREHLTDGVEVIVQRVTPGGSYDGMDDDTRRQQMSMEIRGLARMAMENNSGGTLPAAPAQPNGMPFAQASGPPGMPFAQAPAPPAGMPFAQTDGPPTPSAANTTGKLSPYDGLTFLMGQRVEALRAGIWLSGFIKAMPFSNQGVQYQYGVEFDTMMGRLVGINTPNIRPASAPPPPGQLPGGAATPNLPKGFTASKPQSVGKFTIGANNPPANSGMGIGEKAGAYSEGAKVEVFDDNEFAFVQGTVIGCNGGMVTVQYTTMDGPETKTVSHDSTNLRLVQDEGPKVYTEEDLVAMDPWKATLAKAGFSELIPKFQDDHLVEEEHWELLEVDDLRNTYGLTDEEIKKFMVTFGKGAPTTSMMAHKPSKTTEAMAAFGRKELGKGGPDYSGVKINEEFRSFMYWANGKIMGLAELTEEAIIDMDEEQMRAALKSRGANVAGDFFALQERLKFAIKGDSKNSLGKQIRKGDITHFLAIRINAHRVCRRVDAVQSLINSCTSDPSASYMNAGRLFIPLQELNIPDQETMEKLIGILKITHADMKSTVAETFKTFEGNDPVLEVKRLNLNGEQTEVGALIDNEAGLQSVGRIFRCLDVAINQNFSKRKTPNRTGNVGGPFFKPHHAVQGVENFVPRIPLVRVSGAGGGGRGGRGGPPRSTRPGSRGSAGRMLHRIAQDFTNKQFVFGKQPLVSLILMVNKMAPGFDFNPIVAEAPLVHGKVRRGLEEKYNCGPIDEEKAICFFDNDGDFVEFANPDGTLTLQVNAEQYLKKITHMCEGRGSKYVTLEVAGVNMKGKEETQFTIEPTGNIANLISRLREMVKDTEDTCKWDLLNQPEVKAAPAKPKGFQPGDLVDVAITDPNTGRTTGEWLQCRVLQKEAGGYMCEATDNGQRALILPSLMKRSGTRGPAGGAARAPAARAPARAPVAPKPAARAPAATKPAFVVPPPPAETNGNSSIPPPPLPSGAPPTKAPSGLEDIEEQERRIKEKMEQLRLRKKRVKTKKSPTKKTSSQDVRTSKKSPPSGKKSPPSEKYAGDDVDDYGEYHDDGHGNAGDVPPPPSQPPKPKASAGTWKKAKDKKTGYPYWYNSATKATTWDPPAGWTDPDAVPPPPSVPRVPAARPAPPAAVRPPPPAAVSGPPTLAPGVRVKIKDNVQGFSGQTGALEKYLKAKNKWGIMLDGGSRVALHSSSFQPDAPSNI